MKITSQLALLLLVLLQNHCALSSTLRGESQTDEELETEDSIVDPQEQTRRIKSKYKRRYRSKGKGKSGSRSSGKGGKGGYSNIFHQNEYTLKLTVINESFNQPFSPFFVMVHNRQAMPLYRRGQPASPALARLAEDGTPSQLVEFYTQNSMGVLSTSIHNDGAPYVGGESTEIEVTLNRNYPMVTIATMAINTNDCFVSINGMVLRDGMVLDLPGLDAGSEENNEMCSSIPGPGCMMTSGNVASGNGEGFVHVHRGFHGVGDLLPQSRYDWRNPMMRVVVSD